MTKRRLWTNEIERELSDGGLVIAGRQTGKTTALLNLAEKLGAGNCVVVVQSRELGDYLQTVWRRMFPENPIKICPSFVVAERDGSILYQGRGRRSILVDEFFKSRYRGEFFAATTSASERCRTVMIGDGGEKSEVKMIDDGWR